MLFIFGEEVAYVKQRQKNNDGQGTTVPIQTLPPDFSDKIETILSKQLSKITREDEHELLSMFLSQDLFDIAVLEIKPIKTSDLNNPPVYISAFKDLDEKSRAFLNYTKGKTQIIDILNEKGNQIFNTLPPESQEKVEKILAKGLAYSFGLSSRVGEIDSISKLYSLLGQNQDQNP